MQSTDNPPRPPLPHGARVGELVEYPAVRPEYEHFYTDRPDAGCWVYEVWDTRGRLAYVGIADNFERRWYQHTQMSWWLGEIDVWYVFLLGYRTRGEARRMEAAMIHDQHPVYNTNMEHASYRAYRAMQEHADESDCSPVKKRMFAPDDSDAFL